MRSTRQHILLYGSLIKAIIRNFDDALVASEVGYAKSVREVRAVVSAIVAKKYGVKEFVVSMGWWESFQSRHPELTLRAGEGGWHIRFLLKMEGHIESTILFWPGRPHTDR